MIQPGFLAFFSILYIGILFAIAWYGDTRARQGSPLPYRGVIYSLSLAVYCTSWTYYGAVGKASTAGLGIFFHLSWADFIVLVGIRLSEESGQDLPRAKYYHDCRFHLFTLR